VQDHHAREDADGPHWTLRNCGGIQRFRSSFVASLQWRRRAPVAFEGDFAFGKGEIKGYAPANAEAQCRGGGGAAGRLNEKFPKPTFFWLFHGPNRFSE